MHLVTIRDVRPCLGLGLGLALRPENGGLGLGLACSGLGLGLGLGVCGLVNIPGDDFCYSYATFSAGSWFEQTHRACSTPRNLSLVRKMNSSGD